MRRDHDYRSTNGDAAPPGKPASGKPSPGRARSTPRQYTIDEINRMTPKQLERLRKRMVIRVTRPTEEERKRALIELDAVVQKMRADVARSGLTQKQLDSLINKAVREVRRKNAQSRN